MPRQETRDGIHNRSAPRYVARRPKTLPRPSMSCLAAAVARDWREIGASNVDEDLSISDVNDGISIPDVNDDENTLDSTEGPSTITCNAGLPSQPPQLSIHTVHAVEEQHNNTSPAHEDDERESLLHTPTTTAFHEHSWVWRSVPEGSKKGTKCELKFCGQLEGRKNFDGFFVCAAGVRPCYRRGCKECMGIGG